MSWRDMSSKLDEFGLHGRDAVELRRKVDREWLIAHPEESDPDEWFTISKKPDTDQHRYGMMSDRREGFKIQHAGTPDEVIRQLVARGFDRVDVEARLAEVESLWEQDVKTGRNKPGSLDVARRGDGYVWRTFGDAWVRGRPLTAEQLKRALYFHDQADLDSLIARADREWHDRHA
jgi:hypothetical protein